MSPAKTKGKPKGSVQRKASPKRKAILKGRVKAAPTVKPKCTCSALLVGDYSVTQADSRKAGILGIFSKISAVSFPAVQPQLSILFSLTDGIGEYSFILQLKRPKKKELIFEVQGQVRTTEPLGYVDVAIALPNAVTFHEPGVHTLELSVEGKVLMTRRIIVEQVSLEGQVPS